MADIDRLLRLLRPLMPEKVGKWRRARDSGDAELRTLVERRIVSEAYRCFGDPNRIPLSLPPQKVARGSIHLGTIVYDRERWPLGLFPRELTQHLAILGRSGAGKSNVAFHLLTQLGERRVPFLFLDFKRTARHLLPMLGQRVDLYTAGRSLRAFPFNPFVPPPGTEPEVYANQVVDVLSEAFTLGAGAESLILHALKDKYAKTDAPSIDSIIESVRAAPDNARSKGWKATALRALESVADTCGSVGSPDEQRDLMHRLLRRSTILELDSLGQGGRRFLCSLLCLWLYTVRLARPERESLQYAVFVEEAHHLLHRNTQRSHESVMEMVLRQCRELGMAFVIIDQHPALLSPAAMGNVFASICLNLKDPTDINRAAALSQVEDKSVFGRLPVGHGVVKLQDRVREPVLVKFPLMGIEKGSVSDSDLALPTVSKGAGSGARGAETGEIGGVRRVRVPDHAPDEAEMAFLEDVLAHPDDGVKSRYRCLKFSGDKGTRVKGRLLRTGWLEGAIIPVGNSRKLVLRLSRRARESLGLPAPPGTRRESVAHEYWKRRWAEHLRGQGYEVQVEAPRKGGFVDVLGVKNGETVAVEIETGESDVVGNVKNCLRSGFGRVIAVATGGSVRGRIEGALAAEGLLIAGRVKLASATKNAA